ncbi:MAG: hypothetical protein EPN62_00810 [Candidimonas sp.]|nr:MAG: hypothetical protein EPN77_01810 [Candidimonas sp.]TAM26871.1 MAG: hypothetical protein EPN62_00810 [Candidimonas sp.]
MATPESTITLKKNNDVPSNSTVVVASKLPMDLILKLFDFKRQSEPVMGGGMREYKIAQPRPDTKVFVVQGNSFPQNKGAHQQIAHGFAITRDIPKAFWDEWLEQNKNSDYVRNGMIFAHEESASTMAEAHEKEGVKSNLERLDPNNLPDGLKTSDEMRRAA